MNYMWMVDRNEKVMNKPDDTVHEWSNSMDAIRYAINSMTNHDYEEQASLSELPEEDMEGFY